MSRFYFHQASRQVKTPFAVELEAGASRIGFVGALACIAAVAAMAWSLPRGATAGGTAGVRSAAHPVEVMAPASMPHGDRAEGAAAKPGSPADDPAKVRGKAACAECGIVVAMQRIDTPLQFTGWCDAAEIARTQSSGRAYGRDFRADRESLRETVAAAIASNRTSTKDAVTTRHRIVVRMGNGSRQIFDESTPRMVNVGDRMVVIAGAQRTAG
jgi:hypothetical protein